MAAQNGRCCSCGYEGQEETPCEAREDETGSRDDRRVADTLRLLRLAMRVYLDGDALVFAGDNRKETEYLQELYKREHLHFVCKAFLPNKRGTKGGLYLKPSIIRWQRPKRANKPPSSK